MRYLSLFTMLLLFQGEVKAQETPGCKCDYYSKFHISSYLSTLDSLVAKVRKSKHESVQVVGSRGYAAATLMIVVKRHNLNRGYYYDLGTKKMKIVEGKVLNVWLKNLEGDSSFLHTAKADPRRLPSHDHSFFVSFRYPNVGLKEICYSQLLSDTKRLFGRELMSSLSLFK